MVQKTLLASALALVSLTSYAVDYYVVVPVKNKTVNLSDVNVALQPSSLPSGIVGTAYSYPFQQNLQITGDATYTGAGVTWAVSSGNLPAGLTLDAKTGVLSGVPTTQGTSIFTLQALYKTNTGIQSYQLPVSLGITVALGSAPSSNAVKGVAYTYDLKPLLSVQGDNAYNGSGVTWSVVDSTLPAGLSLRTDGTIAGTPTAAGTGTALIRASYRSVTAEQTYQVVALADGPSVRTDSATGTIVTYTVPVSGIYTLDATGASGGANTGWGPLGGRGARLSCQVALTQGTVLKILVGMQGATEYVKGGGGGGTFIAKSDNTPLVVAGGGGGAYTGYGGYSGKINSTTSTEGGGSGGGAGFIGDGDVAKSFINGGAGGLGGGFGGGGFLGGGGMSGGPILPTQNGHPPGDGGSSYCSGTLISSNVVATYGHGSSEITFVR